MADLEAELTALRGQIARMKSDLEALAEAESMLSEKLRALGLDESVTSVDLPTVAGLPSRRRRSSSRPPPAVRSPAWVPAAVGAGLLLGVVIVVLQAMNLQARRAEQAPAASVTVASAPMPPAPDPGIPPPEPIRPTAAAAPSSSAATPEMGALSIVCTPRCDSIVDNGVPLSPGNLVALPVAAGPHKVVLTSGGVKKTYSLTIGPGQTRELKADLEKPTPPDRGF